MSLQLWTEKVITMGRDSFRLIQALAKAGKNQRRDVVLNQARRSNSAAMSLLQVDKVWGLVRYLGPAEYIRQRWQHTLPDAARKHVTQTPTNTPMQAKIVFMITSEMKSELTNRLGYETNHIKQLTPLQASLILHHDIEPKDLEEKLPSLEQQHAEEERKRQEEEQLRRREQEEQQHATAQQYALSQPAGDPRTRGLSLGNYMSSNLLATNNSQTSGFADNWFEVIESKNGESSRVGLYLDEEEAHIGCETRQMIADRKGAGLHFHVNRISGGSI